MPFFNTEPTLCGPHRTPSPFYLVHYDCSMLSIFTHHIAGDVVTSATQMQSLVEFGSALFGGISPPSKPELDTTINVDREKGNTAQRAMAREAWMVAT